MQYIYVENGIACELIPGEDSNFPGILITERYAPDFLAKCVEVPEGTEVRSGMIYDVETGSFTEPPKPEENKGE